jgi:hypothetical protein
MGPWAGETVPNRAAKSAETSNRAGTSPGSTWEESIPEATARAKAPGQDRGWCVGGVEMRPAWLKQREQRGEEEGMGQVTKVLVHCSGDLCSDLGMS